MKLRHLIHTLITVICLSAALTASAGGFMQIRNFTRNAYTGGPQNWAVAQDSIGRIYVGNRDGMLSFDGERWQKHPLPNLTTVRSLLYDHESERIYCGGTEEFGYFEPDPVNGKLAYVSLTSTLDETGGRPAFTEVWNVIKTDRTVWFQCDNLLLRYDGKRTAALSAPSRISCSEGIGGTIYIGTEDGLIARADANGLAIMHRAPALSGSKIRAILPLGSKLLVATEVNGLFTCDIDHVDPLPCDINGFLKDNQLFCAVGDGMGNYVFGTVTNGAVVKNFTAGTTRYVNKECGMQNNTVLNAAFDKAGNIWLCLDNGLDYAIYNSPISNIIGTANDAGAGYVSFLSADTMYFGTNQGLFSTPYPFRASPSPLALTRRLQGQIWSINAIDGQSFFVAGDAGAYVSTPAGFNKVDGLTGTYCIRALRNAPAAVASCYDGFHLLRLDNGSWTDNGLIANSPRVSGEFEIDGSNNIWISHWLKGVYRMSLELPQQRFGNVKFFTDADGLPSSRNNNVAIYRGRAIIVNMAGFSTLDADDNRFVTDDELTALFKEATPLSLHCGDGAMALIERKGIRVVRSGFAESAVSELTMAKSLNEGLVNGFEHVNILSPNEIIVSNQNGFWTIDPEKNTNGASSWQPRPLISTIYANGDSLVYRRPGSTNANIRLTLPYNLNSLRFDFTCPDYRSDGGVRYSSRLDGYDDDWSQPSTESSREYTKLPEGRYTLHLRTTNLQNDLESETQLAFTIAPPWFRSTTAKIAYISVILLLGASSVSWIKRWKNNAERRMESQKEEELAAMRHRAEQEALQKDYQIATLKSEQLEVDIKHKSNELSSATMNVIRKNEILNDIASKISKIQSDKSLDQSVQKQLAQIQTSIGRNISHDDDWTTFNRNFDVVYGDYTKRLLEQHPHLSKADIRLCCYIKMGLTSKEIAPLINISFKSVEMARYRLRKKMDLPAETSLTDYISSL